MTEHRFPTRTRNTVRYMLDMAGMFGGPFTKNGVRQFA